MAHGDKVHLSCNSNLYSYSVAENEWITLPSLPMEISNFSLAVIKNILTSIGGSRKDHNSQKSIINFLFCLEGNTWNLSLPPMLSKRDLPAVAGTETHLVVAGSKSDLEENSLNTVEVFDIEAKQWSRASNLPRGIKFPEITLCEDSIYISEDSKVFSCTMEDLLKTCYHLLIPPSISNLTDSCTWTRLADIPAAYGSSLASLGGQVLAIGGEVDQKSCEPKAAIYAHNTGTNSWSVVSKMLTPRSNVLTAVIPHRDELLVAGGDLSMNNLCTVVEIGMLAITAPC